jgi:hypothetical protein
MNFPVAIQQKFQRPPPIHQPINYAEPHGQICTNHDGRSLQCGTPKYYVRDEYLIWLSSLQVAEETGLHVGASSGEILDFWGC